MAKKQYYGIRYPFMSDNEENYFTNVNYDTKDKVKSLIMHVIFTPKGQKLRDPEFGTNLIRYIFEPNDNDSWENIKSEISEAVSKYVNGVKINGINMMENEDNDSHLLYVRVDYSIMNGFKTINDSLIAQL